MLLKNGKEVTAFAPRTGAIGHINEHDEVTIEGMGGSQRGPVGSMPGIKWKLIKVNNIPLQSLISECIVNNKDSLKPGMVDVPIDIDDKVGFLKLESMGVEMDTLTEEQYNYIHGYAEGT